MKVGDLVRCEYGTFRGTGLAIKGGTNAALIQLVSLQSPLWVSAEYLEVVSESR